MRIRWELTGRRRLRLLQRQRRKLRRMTRITGLRQLRHSREASSRALQAVSRKARRLEALRDNLLEALRGNRRLRRKKKPLLLKCLRWMECFRSPILSDATGIHCPLTLIPLC